jgi:hypothetical protein
MPPDFERKLNEYLGQIRLKKDEFDKRSYFKSIVMEGWFGINPRFISFEKDRVDLRFASILFETKTEVNESTREKAKEELRKYLEKYRNTTRCVITDCVYFEIYDVSLTKPLKTFDISKRKRDETEEDYLRRVFNSLYEMLRVDPNRLPLEPKVFVPNMKMVIEQLLQRIDKTEEKLGIKFKAWRHYVSRTFGTDSDATPELFVRDALLYYVSVILLARVLGYEDSVDKILDGDPFYADNILNFIEKDNLFDFLDHRDYVLRAIDDVIKRYDLTRKNISEVFRVLYEEFVSPSDRHQLGEFYTPKWLANLVVNKVVNPRAVTLDPACGSGTFLSELIDLKAKAGLSPEDIVSQVIGFDINPIAVAIARANYLAAMLDLNYKPHIINVFLADSLMPTPYERGVHNLQYYVGEDYIPINFSEIVPGTPSVNFYYKKDWDVKDMIQYINELSKFKDPLNINGELLKTIQKLKEQGKNHIWFYIIRNIYTPYFFLKKVDIVIGNPPWLTYRDVKNPQRQRFLDSLYSQYNMGAGSQNKPNQDLAGFFIVRSAEYLRMDSDPTICFVMTRSIMNGAQYDGLRRGKWKIASDSSGNASLNLAELWDLELNPFNKLSCVVIFKKQKMDRQIDGLVIGPKKEASIKEEQHEVEVKSCKLYLNLTENYSSISYTPVSISTKSSPYREKFKKGATIFPRPYFFVEVGVRRELASAVFTASEYGQNANKKRRKGEFEFQWNGDYVPNDLIYDVVLGEDIQPFYLDLKHKAVLPLKDGKFIFKKTVSNGKVNYQFNDATLKNNALYEKFRNFFEEIEDDWEKYRGEKYEAQTIPGNSQNKKESRGMDILNWLNYSNKLILQKLNYNYIVVYNESGTAIRAAVTDKKVIVDSKAYYSYFDKAEEAYYICGILNSHTLLNRLRDLGILSERHITKKPFDVFIPEYWDSQATDLKKQISDIARRISEKAEAKESYESEMETLDALVDKLFNEYRK